MRTKVLKLSSVIFAAIASSAAAGSWYQSPPNTRFLPPGVDPLKVSVINNYKWNLENTNITAQWSDIFYPNTPSGWSDAMIAKAPCVYVHYHGGGWTGGDPRDTVLASDNSYVAAQKPEILRNVVNRFSAPQAAGGFGCITVTMSYPLSSYDSSGNLLNNLDGPSTIVGKPVTLKKIIGSIYVQGSVYWTFNQFYTNHFSAWKAKNPTLQLYVGGVSAGAYIAQRVATSGNWPVSASLLMSPPILNPRSADLSMRSRLDTTNPVVSRRCTSAFFGDSRAYCDVLSKIYEYSENGFNANDLKNFYLNSSLQMTYVIGNICDNVTDMGSIVKGWFNTLPPTKRQLYVHVGFNNTPSPSDTSHGNFAAMYADFFSTGAPGLPNGTKWLANGVSHYSPATIGSIHPQFASNCTDSALPFIKDSIQN